MASQFSNTAATIWPENTPARVKSFFNKFFYLIETVTGETAAMLEFDDVGGELKLARNELFIVSQRSCGATTVGVLLLTQSNYKDPTPLNKAIAAQEARQLPKDVKHSIAETAAHVESITKQATGNLGSKILVALNNAGFIVTAIQRKDSRNVVAGAARSIKVDFSSESDLIAAFKGQDVVISAAPNPRLATEKIWMEAAISAGGKAHCSARVYFVVALSIVNARVMRHNAALLKILNILYAILRRQSLPGIALSYYVQAL
ncbi:hypothetical protein B0J14DRAFT_658335 [Halenospora varia]|nr:hypothetical protein B0J14DRAFT_658335 [Halenospora varia]